MNDGRVARASLPVEPIGEARAMRLSCLSFAGDWTGPAACAVLADLQAAGWDRTGASEKQADHATRAKARGADGFLFRQAARSLPAHSASSTWIP